jgi:hypothetical protein
VPSARGVSRAAPSGGREVGRDTVKVPAGGSVTIEVLRPKEPPPRLRPVVPGHPGEPVEVPLHGRVTVAPHDAGAPYDEATRATGDGGSYQESRFIETSHELRLGYQLYEYQALVDQLIRNSATTTMTHSRRETGPYRWQAGSDDTDGLLAALTFQLANGAGARRYEVISESPTWSRRVPAATRRAELVARKAEHPEEALEIDEALARLDREEWEYWDGWTSLRVGAEGTFTADLLAGRWQMGLASARHFEPFRLGSDAYKVTERGAYQATAVEAPTVPVGAAEGCHVDLYAVSQLHEFTLRWWDEYIFITFVNYGIIWLPNVGRYMNRLPFYPRQYRLAAPTEYNSIVVSEHAARTVTYARMRALAYANQTTGGGSLFSLLYNRSVAGRWFLRQRELPEGRLCAIVDMRPQRAPARRYYAWGATTIDRDYELLDDGPLETQEVVGDNGQWNFIIPNVGDVD